MPQPRPSQPALRAILGLVERRCGRATAGGGARPVVFHYQLHSRNGSYAVSTEARKARTYNSDLRLPWGPLEAALAHTVRVGGRDADYRFRRFNFE